MEKIKNKNWETNRLILSEAVLEEADRLQKICENWENKEIIEGSDFESDYIYKCITEGDLPPIPQGNKENYRLKSIYLKDIGKIIGFTDIYYGYPSEDTVWISIFLIDKGYRKNGYAQEAMACLVSRFKRKGYKKVGIGVQLKNWTALRFWTKAGFNKVLGVFGDDTYGDNTYALIGLEKELI